MAELGCSSTLQVYIADRSGMAYLFAVPFTSAKWERVLDDTSEATIEVKGEAGQGGSDCCALLEDVRSWANEVVIHRNSKRIWAGPITGMEFDDDGITIGAQDVSAWLPHRRIHENHELVNQDLVHIYQQLAEDAMAVDNVPGLTVRAVLSGILGDRTVLKQQFKMADKELAELTRDGVDWTVLDRLLCVSGDGNPAGTPPFSLTDGHIVSPAKVTEQSAIVTEQTVIGEGIEDSGATVWGVAAQSNQTIIDTYGVHEIVVTEDRIRDAQSALAAARLRLHTFREPPVIFSGGELSDSAPIDVSDLVPGVSISVLLRDLCRRIDGDYFLTKVSGEHGADVDSIKVELRPVNDDLEPEA